MSSRRGNDRENRVLALLGEDGWFGLCGRASLGPADILAIRASELPGPGPHKCAPTELLGDKLVVQVKSDKASPYAHFLPDDRRVLSEVAAEAGAEAWLAWWPPRGTLQWIHEDRWP